MPAVDIRELVKDPIVLTGKFAVHKSAHPLHSGIAVSRQFPSPSAPPIAIPRGGKGLERLQSLIYTSIPGIGPGQSEEAWVKLLAEGTAIHTIPGQVQSGPDGNALNSVDRVRTRSALLVGVFRSFDEGYKDGGLTAARFGGIGVLTVLPDREDPRKIEEAWLRVQWVHSTSAMLRAFGNIDGLSLEYPAVNRRVEILVSPDLLDDHAGLEVDIARTAYLVGVNPRIHVVRPDLKGAIMSEVRANNPFELIALGNAISSDVTGVFTGRHGESNFHEATVDTSGAALDWLYENLPRIMGVSPGLFSSPEVISAPGRPRMPVAMPKRCIHHGKNSYVLDADSDLWWTRDFAQHGREEKSIFKTYSLIDRHMYWQADHDGLGEVIIGKHKGSEGFDMRESEMHSCPHPASHLA